MKHVGIFEAKTHLSSLVDEVAKGGEIVITRHGKPVAKLVPLSPKGDRTPGGYAFGVGDEFFEPLPEKELKAWER